MRYKTLIAFLTAIFIMTSCAPKKPAVDINQQIEQIVAATVMALPADTPAPTYTPYPSPTPFDLKGFFCEYQFCVGHPANISMFDLSAQKNPLTPSKYELGIIAGVSENSYIQLTWQSAPGVTDPQFMFDLVLIPNVDTRSDQPDIKLIRGMNVVYTNITTTLLPALPNGGAGVWTCGDRVFAWKAYTQQADAASALFAEAIEKFTCGQ